MEANGLLPEVTKIHCFVAYNTEKDTWFELTPDNIAQLPQFLYMCSTLSFHNGIGYDLPVIEKVAHTQYKGQCFDTLIVSRILWADKEGKLPHSVETYGNEFGVEKPKHEDWSTYTSEMLHRCKEDVKIQTLIYKKQMTYIEQLSIRDSRITNESMNKVFELEFKVAEIIEQQAMNGWAFDLKKAYELISNLDEMIIKIEYGLLPQMPLKVIRPALKETKAFKQSGQMTANAWKWYYDNIGEFLNCLLNKNDIPATEMIEGDFSKVVFEKFNLSSSFQVKEYLLSKGWKPKEWNYKKDKYGKPERDQRNNLIKGGPKSPKTVEDWELVAEELNDPNIKLLAMYNKANHRKHQIEGFIRNLRPDHRIEAQANTCGTNTARMMHRVVVNVPKADEKVFYGKEMRSLFIASPGKALVGIDACALEARIEAHYIYPFDKAGADEILNGDIHAKNAEIFGCTRSIAKNGKYALTYGCSKSKLAATIGKPPRDATRLYNGFWDGNIGLKQLKERVEKSYDDYGYLLAIDGRPLSIRYKHALINTLFQSAGSIVMKRALVILQDNLIKLGLRFWFVGNFHDEMQIECCPQDAEAIGETACKAIEDAGKYYNLNVPMAGEYKIGTTWAETH
jgi:DNA polymerase I-like protein with 3'-5' exonuclease and polymerase domains